MPVLLEGGLELKNGVIVRMERKHCSGCAVFSGLITKSECETLVQQAGKAGWQHDKDTVDNKPTYQNNLKSRCPGAFGFVKAMCANRINPLLQTLFPGVSLRLTGHFVRRYATGERTTLIPHQDKSFATVNLLLSPDSAYAGGKVFVFDPDASREIAITHKDFLQEMAKNARFGLKLHTGGRVTVAVDADGSVPSTITKRVVQTQFMDAVIHRGALFHGITPLRKGVRHVLILFFSKANTKGEAGTPTTIFNA